MRKKFLLDSLQSSVDAIQAENDSLKGSIVGSLGERGRELVAKCEPADAGGSLVTANPKQATKVREAHAMLVGLPIAHKGGKLTCGAYMYMLNRLGFRNPNANPYP